MCTFKKGIKLLIHSTFHNAVFLLGLWDFKSQRQEIRKICCKLHQIKLNWDLTHAIFQVPPLIFQVFSYRGCGEQKFGNGFSYLSMLGLKLNHVNKRSPRLQSSAHVWDKVSHNLQAEIHLRFV